MDGMTFRDALAIVQVTLIPLVGYVTYVIRDVRTQIHSIDKRAASLEEWARGHERLDDQRFDELHRKLT